MIPVVQVLGMLASMYVSNQLTTAAASSASRVAGLTVGGTAGAFGGAILTRPSVVKAIVVAPFRLINAPFYYLSGTHRLHAVVGRTQADFNAYISRLSAPWTELNSIQVTATEAHINALKNSFSSTNRYEPQQLNFIDASFFSTPNNEACSVIVLNKHATTALVAVVMIIGTYLIIKLIVFIIRMTIRYGLRSKKELSQIVTEEQNIIERTNSFP